MVINNIFLNNNLLNNVLLLNEVNNELNAIDMGGKMKNIKKIMVSLYDQDKIKRIVVVYEDKIERYTNKSLSQSELRNIYSECVRTLKKENSVELVGLDSQGQVNKLDELGKIERNEDNLIVNLTEYDNATKFVVTYENGTKIIRELVKDGRDKYTEEYSKMLENICNVYEVPITNSKETISKLKKIGLYSKNEEKEDLFDVEDSDNVSDDLTEVVKEHKIRNFVVNHKGWIISGLIGTGILAVLVHSGIKSAKKSETREDNSNKTTIELELPEETEKPEFVFIPVDEIPRPTVKPVEEKLEYVPEIYILDENNLFNGYTEPTSQYILTKDVNGGETLGLNESLESLIEIRNNNMDSIENYIQSDIPMNNNGKYIYFENLFNDYELSDKAYVKYFSMLGNQIIKCAYRDKNFDINTGVNKYSKQSCYDVLRYIRDNKPLEKIYLNGTKQNLYYSDLSRDAKEAVLNIVWSNYTALNTYPSLYNSDENREESLLTEFRYNNEFITKSDIADIIMAAYDNLSLRK